MINVEAEVSKYKSCKDRDELSRLISDYKNQALQCSNDIIKAGQYNMVAHKLQEICDKLPAPHFKNIVSSAQGAPVKTAKISNEEKAKINVAWSKKAGKH
jgi:hypothetical protein